MFAQRHQKIVGELKSRHLDALVLNPGPSLVYLTGLHFHLSERPIIAIFIQDGRVLAILPELELLQLENAPCEIQGFTYPEDPAEWEASFSRVIRSLDLDGRSVGVEQRQMRLLEYRYLLPGAPRASYPDASGVISSLRIHKDRDETNAMQAAVKVAQMALENCIPLIKIGMTERELASELTLQLLRNGTQPEALSSPIVSGGPNSANPHASPGDRKLQVGDLLVIDWGAVINGYYSDLTRTLAIGDVPAEFKKVHQVVLEANEAARSIVKPDLSCAMVDRAAREVIDRAGYGRYFTHRTGHGLGMEVHEEPYIRGDNMQMLEAGMTFTVEPGIYLPDRGGVRIEDNMAVTGTGADCLSDMTRELLLAG